MVQWRSMHSSAIGGELRYLVAIPKQAGPFPTIYLLHGRGESAESWAPVFEELAELPPHIAIFPDAPWSNRASYYVDSAHPTGHRVETAIAHDLVQHIDYQFPTRAHRDARTIGGYSMGGAGAVRLGLAHPQTFGSIIALSPAIYLPEPPEGSSARKSNAFGVPARHYDRARYRELSYPTLIEAFPPGLSSHLYIAAGDTEEPHPGAPDELSIASQSAKLAEAAHHTRGLNATFTTYTGGHNFKAWLPPLLESVQSILAGT
jgi:enterochelin esterase-like enzyme